MVKARSAARSLKSEGSRLKIGSEILVQWVQVFPSLAAGLIDTWLPGHHSQVPRRQGTDLLKRGHTSTPRGGKGFPVQATCAQVNLQTWKKHRVRKGRLGWGSVGGVLAWVRRSVPFSAPHKVKVQHQGALPLASQRLAGPVGCRRAIGRPSGRRAALGPGVPLWSAGAFLLLGGAQFSGCDIRGWVPLDVPRGSWFSILTPLLSSQQPGPLWPPSDTALSCSLHAARPWAASSQSPHC